MYTYETPGPISVTINVGAGHVRILAGDRADTVVAVRPTNESNGSDVKAAEATRVEYSNGNLTVRATAGRYSLFGGGGSVDITIELPVGSEVNGRSDMGRYDGEGTLGECTLRTGMGGIQLDRTGRLTVSTGHGDVAVGGVVGDADVATGSGAIRLGRIQGAASIRNSNGETRLGEVTGEIEARSANGGIDVERAHRSVSAKTANGKVRVRSVEGGSVVLETSVGDIDIGVREGTTAWLDVATRHGNVRSSLDAAGGPGPSDSTVEVRARITVGDILVGRAAAAQNLTGRAGE